MVVNIYVYQTGKKKGAYCYILELIKEDKPITLTDTGILEPMSENKAELTVLLKALGRIVKECEVVVYGSSDHIKTGVEKWLKDWVRADWKNAKGKEVANKDKWQQLLAFVEKYNITISEQKKHSYTSWMKREIGEHQ